MVTSAVPASLRTSEPGSAARSTTVPASGARSVKREPRSSVRRPSSANRARARCSPAWALVRSFSACITSL
jgi:hypothetical protein